MTATATKIPSWATPAIAEVAMAIRCTILFGSGRRNVDLDCRVLADMLEEAGCDRPILLRGLRSGAASMQAEAVQMIPLTRHPGNALTTSDNS